MSNFPTTIFRAYDIRGIATGHNPEITEAFAENLGLAIGYYFCTHLGVQSPQLAVGRDIRTSGLPLQQALTRGLLRAGVRIVNIGTITSPYLYYAVCAGSLDGGIAITASHNPGEYNGFKIVSTAAAPIAGEEIQVISHIAQDILSGKIHAEADTRGSALNASVQNAYFAKLATLAPAARPLTIVLDAGNGSAGLFAPAFFTQLGHTVVPLYCEPDGNFPNHPANPEEIETLHDLQRAVLTHHADLGLAFDGDGDRMGAVDEQGAVIPADKLLILLGADLLTRRPGSRIICDLKCSGIAEDILGDSVIRWKTGHSFIKQKIKESGALLAGEVSGHFYFAEDYYGVDDALLAGAKLASLISRSTTPASTLVSALPHTYTIPDIKISVPDAQKFQTLATIVAHCQATYASVLTLDGARVRLPSGAWFLIRASNTAPYLTVRAEGSSTATLTEAIHQLTAALSTAPELDTTTLTALA